MKWDGSVENDSREHPSASIRQSISSLNVLTTPTPSSLPIPKFVTPNFFIFQFRVFNLSYYLLILPFLPIYLSSSKQSYLHDHQHIHPSYTDGCKNDLILFLRQNQVCVTWPSYLHGNCITRRSPSNQVKSPYSYMGA